MAMKIGKREQMVGLGIGGILVIGLLHLIVFGPKTKDYSDAYDSVKQQETKMADIKLLKDPKQLDRVMKDLDKVELTYTEATQTSLGLTMDAAFDLPTQDQFIFTPPRGAAADPAAKAAAFHDDRDKKTEKEIELVLGEIKKLMEFDAPVGGSPRKLAATFLRDSPAGWHFPKGLPEGLKGGTLTDTVCEIKESWQIAKTVSAVQKEMKANFQQAWERSLAKLGINYLLYRTPNLLPDQGEYVPPIQKLTYAILVEQNLPPGVQCTGDPTPITRRMLLDMLQIYLPLSPLVDSNGRDMNVNEMYFIYEQLRFVNSMLKIAEDTGVSEVARVRFEDASYLETQTVRNGLPPFAPDEPPEATPAPTPVPPNRYVLPPSDDPNAPPATPGKGQDASARTPLDLGYCLPIVVQFRSSNLSAWSFLYEVLRQNRLSEIDRLRIAAAATTERSETAEEWVEVRFLHIPFIFALEPKRAAPPPAPPAAAGAKKKP